MSSRCTDMAVGSINLIIKTFKTWVEKLNIYVQTIIWQFPDFEVAREICWVFNLLQPLLKNLNFFNW